jgi:hypothetical protein
MTEAKYSHHSHGAPNSAQARQDHRPYWKRAHRDWRVWVGLCLMLAAMAIFVLSGNLAFMPGQLPPASGAVRQ